MKKILLALLSVLFFLDLFRFGLKLAPHFFIIVTVSFLTDYLLIRVRRLPPFLPMAALDTGLIIAFVLDPSASFVFKVLSPILAMTAKHLLKNGERHFFNPAAFGLFGVALLGGSISWWVGASGRLFDLILIVFALPILYRAKRIAIPLTFLTTFFLLRLVLFQEYWPSFSLLFFPLIMLPEPMTSPSLPKEKIVYGAFSALLLVFFGFARLVFVDSFLQTLLIANFLHRVGLTKWFVRAAKL